jgi:hypothetical protein
MADEPKARPRSDDDWDGEPILVLPDIQVEDTPTLIRLPNGRAWRRRIGFAAPTRQDA